MTHPSPAYLNPDPQLVDGIDVDAVVAAVRSCPGVEDLDGGLVGSVASYLPGRRVPGVRVSSNRITVQVKTRWAVPLADVGAQLRAALAPVIAGRHLDIVVSDIADPPATAPLALPAGVSDQETSPWTNASDSVAETSSASTTPTAAAIPTNSSPALPRSTSPSI